MTPVQLRFTEKSHPIFRELQDRIDQLPKEALAYVAVLMGVKDLVPAPLSELVFGMVYVRNAILIGPMHVALAGAVRLRNQHTEAAASMRCARLALIAACQGSATCMIALEFVANLRTLPTSLHSAD